MRRLLLLLVLLCFVPGCRGAGWFVGGALLGAAIASSHQHTEVVYEPIYVYSGPSVYVPPPPPPAREDPPGPPPPSFDQAAARNALDAIDLEDCGAPRGYGHARVTFAAAGNVTKVVVDSPSGLSAEAVACIGQRLGTAEVPAFEGAPVAVGRTWRVR
ncbi:MAG TPA: hypothetical protein VIF62_19530 [Labilithrix sp.]|jgi:hypothetical protein